MRQEETFDINKIMLVNSSHPRLQIRLIDVLEYKRIEVEHGEKYRLAFREYGEEGEVTLTFTIDELLTSVDFDWKYIARGCGTSIYPPLGALS